jgi:hypothetical protein
MNVTFARSGDLSHLSGRLRRHAQWLVDNDRSPLYVVLMRAAADDVDAGGIVATLFDGIPLPRGSVPQLRFVAALHELVLSGQAPELAAFYPSAGGDRDLAGVWPVAERALRDHAQWIRERLTRTVQTNEPGRSTVLYAALLWLTATHRRPVRLLEIGASAGINLACDRFRYREDGLVLGDPGSAVTFDQPWAPPPAVDLATADAALQITAREGCDPAPLDLTDPEGRRRLLSYIWPDEPQRLARLRAVLERVAADPPAVAEATAADWLPGVLARREPGELTVVWESVMRQYVPPGEWDQTVAIVRAQLGADPERPVVWVAMEPHSDRISGCRVTVATTADPGGDVVVAGCGDHGPPVVWNPH